jgi:hypothetical protein
MGRSWYYGFIAAVCLLTAATAPPSEAQQSERGDRALQPQVLVPVHFDVSPPLRDIKPVQPKPRVPREIVNRTIPKVAKGGEGNDTTVQSAQGPGEMPAPLLSIEGLSNADNATVLGGMITPPDTQGDVGPNHYIQWINLIFAIYDKSGNKIYPPQPGPPGAAGNTLWTGFPGRCAIDNDGDPITLYDHLADRWLMAQFSATSPYRECVAISTSGDPTGTWYRYEYVTANNKFPDYPKFGVWPNAYYMSANQFVGLSSWGGQGVWAYDRAAMIAGNPAATIIYIDLYSVNPNFGGGFPADLDGPPAAAGADGIFLEWDDSTWLGDPQDTIRLWYFHPDFVTPANSTFGLSGQPNQLITTANIDPNMCAGSRACIPMPTGGESVDAISDRLMHRLQFRNFGTYQTIVTNITVDADATDHAGVHWFELRKTGATWAINQEGTYAPDSDHRWMGSAAMDANGNIAVGYSVSSASTFPSVRYAGRLAGDPAGTLGQGEAELVAGSGVFTQGNNHRWGDYSMMAVDPADDCTFWYTQEYVAAPGGYWLWNTRFGSFRFPGCVQTPTFTLAVTPLSQSVCAGSDATYTVNVGSVSGFSNPVTLSATGNPAGTTVGFSTNPVTPSGTSTLTIGNTGVATPGAYTIDVQGQAAGPITLDQTVNLRVFGGVPASPTLLTPVDGATNQSVSPTFTWSPATDAATYTLEIATDAAFTSIVHTASGLTTTSYSGATLSSLTQYYWRVWAVNVCGAGSNSSVFSFTTQALAADCPVGAQTSIVYTEGFESGAAGWTHSGTGDTWALSAANPHSGTQSFFAANPATVSDQRLVSPAIAIPAGGYNPVTLQFWNWQYMERTYDGGILEASTDGGTIWTQLGGTRLLTDPYDGPISTCCSNPLAGLNAWYGNNPQPYLNSVVDITSYVGQTVQFRFRLGSDSTVSAPGWYIDDVVVKTCLPDLIFKDGFQSPPASGVLLDSGPLITHTGGGAGGADGSQLQTALGMTLYGFGHQISANNSVADDFTVPAGPGWTVTQMTFFGYQTGSTTTSTINDVRVQLWNGPPNAGGSVIWGDLTTNRLASTTFSNIYRTLDTAPLDTNRPIMKVVATVPTSLAPGTYWVQWQMGGTLASGPWAPPITILGQTTTGNALQDVAGTWQAATDVGPQGFKFIIEGTSP